MGTGAENVIPATLSAQFNLRFSTEQTAEGIEARVREILDAGGFDYTLDWRLSGNPFLTPAGALVEAARESIAEVLGMTPELSTSGGTSDGRFIATLGTQVLELGPLNAHHPSGGRMRGGRGSGPARGDLSRHPRPPPGSAAEHRPATGA